MAQDIIENAVLVSNAVAADTFTGQLPQINETKHDIENVPQAADQLVSLNDVKKVIASMKNEHAKLMKEQQEILIQEVLRRLGSNNQLKQTADGKKSKSKSSDLAVKKNNQFEQNINRLAILSLDENDDSSIYCRQSSPKPNKMTKEELSSPRVRTTDTDVRNSTLKSPIDHNWNNAPKLPKAQPSPFCAKRKLPKQHLNGSIDQNTKCGVRFESQLKGCGKEIARDIHNKLRLDITSIDEAFRDNKTKIDAKTRAIVKRSEFIVDQAMSNQRIRKQGKLRQSISSSTVCPIDCQCPSPKQIETISCATESKIEKRKNEAISQPPDAPITKDIENRDDKQLMEKTCIEGKEQKLPNSIINSDNPHDYKELLEPRSNPPDTESEWENELARQILTIYATSVKAKAKLAAESKNTDGQNNERGKAPTKLKVMSKSLGTSVSLPVLSPGKAHHSAPSRRLDTSAFHNRNFQGVQYSWEPSRKLANGKVVVSMPKIPKPIWFAGTGIVKAVWCGLAQSFDQLKHQNSIINTEQQKKGDDNKVTKLSPTKHTAEICGHNLCELVRQMEYKRQYMQCITSLESVLVSLLRARGSIIEQKNQANDKSLTSTISLQVTENNWELETKLWRQLIVMCNAFASRCVDYRKFSKALELMQYADTLIHHSILVDQECRYELLAFIHDTYAYYYYYRCKPDAGMHYILKAEEIHKKLKHYAHIAKCRLHIATLLSFQGKHKSAYQTLLSILELIEANSLENPEIEVSGTNAAQKLCLTAVCYNNLAVEQLHLREFEQASVSCTNAKKLAKLCLSYSNRWLGLFNATSDCVALAIATHIERKESNTNLETIERDTS